MSDIMETDAPASESHAFEFHGRGGELLPIVLINLLLTIVTFGIYRFWARTKVRQYVWSNTRFMGDSFEYTGKGMELLIGFVIVLVLVFLPFGYLFYEAQTMLLTPGQETAGGALMVGLYLVLFYLIGVAMYRRNVYRLSRTQWRGIRGNQNEHGFKYALQYMGLTLLGIVTLGLATPYMANRLWAYEQNRREFGTGSFSYEASSKPLYKPFLISMAVFVACGVVFGVLAYDSFATIESNTPALEANDVDPAAATEASAAVLQAAGKFFLLYFGFLIVIGPVTLWYVVKQIAHLVGNTRYEGAMLSFHGTYWDLLKTWIGNIFIVVFSLGIAADVAEMRLIRYLVGNVRLTGSLDLEAIAQTTADAPSFGEGLAEGFDLGGI